MVHPVYGFIVFEVKDGQIAFSRERGWIQINRYSGHEKIIDPMEQAERSKYYFLDQIKRRFGGSSPYSFCSAVWFTSGDKACVDGAMPLNYKEETVLWSNDLQSPSSAEMAIRKVYRYYDVKHVVPSNEISCQTNKKIYRCGYQRKRYCRSINEARGEIYASTIRSLHFWEIHTVA